MESGEVLGARMSQHCLLKTAKCMPPDRSSISLLKLMTHILGFYSAGVVSLLVGPRVCCYLRS